MKNIIMLVMIMLVFRFGYGQISYGNNPAAGGYFNTGDAKIYYEVYGSGKPVVLLHGGLYGYIDEYEKLIPELSKKYMVIAIATRGHGRSEMGHQPFSYALFADDSYKVIRHLTKDSVIIIGFSDGADQGYYIAADHPDLVSKIVAIGGNLGYTDFQGDAKKSMDNFSAASMEKNEQGFISERKKLMPEPARFDEFADQMARLWREPVYVSKEKIKAIRCATLIAAGQNDDCPIEQYVAIYRLLKVGQVSIIPGCDHLVLYRKPELMAMLIQSFIE